jgi:hypothetical protein
MKTTLIERMSSKNVSEIEKFTKNYPNTGGWLMNELATKEYWTNLTYESVLTLHNVLNCGYTPTDIDNLFSKK